jgi:hypothetical protein
MMGGMVKSEIETGKDFLRIVSVEGTYTTANKIDYAKIVELETCDIPEGPAPEKEIVDPAWIQRQWSRIQCIQWATIRSPAELRVYDSHGRVTGLVNGEVRNEMPDSFYFEDYVVVLSAFDSYIYEVVGVEKDSYSLEITSITEMETNTFAAIDILISANAIHQYTVDWDALALGEEGVTVQVDSDGDGVFEHTFTSDSELNHDEFVLQTETIIDFDPDTLNLGSKGRWVTAYIEFPEGYDVADVNVSRILLNGTVPVDLAAPTTIGDYDGDGVPDLMVKFDRQAVIDYIKANVDVTELYEKRFMNITLTITGYLYNGTPFQANIKIKITI